MPNVNYQRGRAKEYRIMAREKAAGNIAQRTAGSHGIFDIIVIDKQHSIIKLIQSKPKSMSKNKQVELYEQFKHLEGDYRVEFSVE